MTLLRCLRTCLVTAAFLMTLASSSFAQSGLTFTVNPAQQSGTAGSSVLFTGNITNNTGDRVYLDGMSTNFASPGFTDTDFFFNNAPLFLEDGESVDGALFGLTISSGHASGIFAGTATLSASDTSATTFFNLPQNIQIAVLSTGNVAAPEPGSGALVASAFLPLLLVGFYRKHRRTLRNES